jgi:hypothetical protein
MCFRIQIRAEKYNPSNDAAALSKILTALDSSNTGSRIPIPLGVRVHDLCILLCCTVLYCIVVGLATGRSPAEDMHILLQSSFLRNHLAKIPLDSEIYIGNCFFITIFIWHSLFLPPLISLLLFFFFWSVSLRMWISHSRSKMILRLK